MRTCSSSTEGVVSAASPFLAPDPTDPASISTTLAGLGSKSVEGRFEASDATEKLVRDTGSGFLLESSIPVSIPRSDSAVAPPSLPVTSWCEAPVVADSRLVREMRSEVLVVVAVVRDSEDALTDEADVSIGRSRA